jgi:hypothetical protein
MRRINSSFVSLLPSSRGRDFLAAFLDGEIDGFLDGYAARCRKLPRQHLGLLRQMNHDRLS